MTVYYFWSFKAILLLRLVNWFLCMFDLRVSVFPKWSWLVGQQFGQNGQNWIRLQNHFRDKTVEGTWNKPHFRAVGEGGGRGITPETLGMHHALLPCFQSKPLLQVSTSRETSSTAKVFARTFIHCQVFFLEKSSILGNKDYNKVINTKGLIMIVGR